MKPWLSLVVAFTLIVGGLVAGGGCKKPNEEGLEPGDPNVTTPPGEEEGPQGANYPEDGSETPQVPGE